MRRVCEDGTWTAPSGGQYAALSLRVQQLEAYEASAKYLFGHVKDLTRRVEGLELALATLEHDLEKLAVSHNELVVTARTHEKTLFDPGTGLAYKDALAAWDGKLDGERSV